jgi:hypothetical protein
VTYLSNYATASSAVLDELNSYCVVIISRTQPDHPILIFPDFEINYFNYQPTWIKDLRPYRSLMAPTDRPDTSIDIFLSEELKTKDWVLELRDKYAPNLIAAAVSALEDLGLASGRIGFDNLSYAPEVTKRLPGIEVLDGYRGLKWVRMIKSDSEIALMRKSQRLNQEAITRTVADGGAGMTWFELNDAYFRNVLDLGGFVFDRGSMVLFNPKGTDPTLQISTGLEQDYTLEPGTHVMFDCPRPVEPLLLGWREDVDCRPGARGVRQEGRPRHGDGDAGADGRLPAGHEAQRPVPGRAQSDGQDRPRAVGEGLHLLPWGRPGEQRPRVGRRDGLDHGEEHGHLGARGVAGRPERAPLHRGSRRRHRPRRGPVLHLGRDGAAGQPLTR